MKNNPSELYKELGVVTYNIELHKAVLEQLEQTKIELLHKIEEIENKKSEDE